MSKPSAQGLDPVHGWDFYYMFYISTNLTPPPPLPELWRLSSLKIGFLLGWLHNKGTFSGPLIVRERCERSQQRIDRFRNSLIRDLMILIPYGLFKADNAEVTSLVYSVRVSGCQFLFKMNRPNNFVRNLFNMTSGDCFWKFSTTY